MSAPTEERQEYPWVTRLREAGYEVRTGTGVLSREPDASLGPPPRLWWPLRRAVHFGRERWDSRGHGWPRRRRPRREQAHPQD